METNGKFYLGRIFDPALGKLTEKPLLYEPDDLTTHGIVVGMTGSGKTGLCIGLLEEAALQNVPAMMIDPKGDITNMLLHFPGLQPADFQPWVNVDEARRNGKSPEQAAADTASLWANGLAEWGITPERIQALDDAVQFTVFTPGSDAGIPVSILASLKAPVVSWESNREILREQISGTVTGLLGLVGLTDIDPVRSREHILLANIFENAWSQGKDLTLGELILQTQSPPFEKLGVFDVNTFFPEKDRFGLAMLLNNILAAPSFQSWIEGQPLDVESLLYTPQGKPRHSIFYIAHLNDAERMFFVTLLFSAVETWMRAQTGSTTLRALLYFDEIFGYLPPTSNPASKAPMLRMLKQARAFGVGLLLATQNPVDVDYKALSNAGSWFIGKLQTDQDKQRLLDGLQGAAPGIDRADYDRLLSTLGKRVFLLHNVHEKMPALFQTRWVMNYLAGPLTRAQIPALNALAGAQIAGVASQTGRPAPPGPGKEAGSSPSPQPRAAAASGKPSGDELPGTSTRPPVIGRIDEYFLPNNLTVSESYKRADKPIPAESEVLALLYRPVLLGQASIRFLDRRYNLDSEMVRTIMVAEPDERGFVRWEEFISRPVHTSSLEREPDPRGRFIGLAGALASEKVVAGLQKDFADWAYRTSEVKVLSNSLLKVFAGPEVSAAAFRQQCAEAARARRDEEVQKTSATYDKKIDTLQVKLEAEERELDQDESELSSRKMDELGTHAETVMKFFSKRRKSLSSSMNKRRMTDKAKADVKESKDAIASLKQQIAELEKEKTAALDAIQDRWGEAAAAQEEIAVRPTKTNVYVELFGVAWVPYHLIQSGAEQYELSGYGE